MTLAAFTQQDLNVLAGGSLLFLLALSVVARAQRKMEIRRPDLREPSPPGAAVGDSLRDLMLQLEETNRRVSAAVDTRFQMLNRLLAEADAKIAEMKRLSEAQPGGSPAADDTRFLEIYAFADQGLDPVEIARRTNRQRGEVDLILSLRKSGK